MLESGRPVAALARKIAIFSLGTVSFGANVVGDVPVVTP
jgi:hypothetical protein